MKKPKIIFFALFCLLAAMPGFSQEFKLKSGHSSSRDIYDSRFTVEATVMDNDAWCRVEWPNPVGNPWELIYDDGEADDYFIYQNPGNLNANKFIPTFHPYIVTGGRIHVGDGTFPGPFLGTTFRVLVYDDDGEDGLPGTALDSMDVTVENYEWVEFEGLTAEIAAGNFYLAMKQLASSPDAAPLGVDTDNPTYFRSYSLLLGAPGWVLCPLQDLMIRAFITGYNEPARAIDSFEVARFSGFEYNEPPLTGDTTVLDTITPSEYNDYGWDELDPGLYAYGVKTHFTGGEWSDYDVSNLVTHIFYPFPPACFYQSDNGNQQLVICPPADLNGTLPNYFTGFNLYVDGALNAFLPPSSTSYIPDLPGPAIYSCMLTAVYELSLYGIPEEITESIPLTTDYAVSYGLPLPFLEQWNSGTFETNNWLPEGENWSINWQEGQPDPSAEFTWDPIQSDYQISLESYPLLAGSMTEGHIYLDFDLKLDNFNPTGIEEMLVQVWNWINQEWNTVSTYSNIDGDFDWISEHLVITDQAIGNVFKIRFLASGENSLDLIGWYVDNIHVYRECNPPRDLEFSWVWENYDIELTWTPPLGTGIENYSIHWDDGMLSGNSIGGPLIFDVAARWDPDQLSQFDGGELIEIAFAPYEAASTYHVRAWVGSGDPAMVIDQIVENPVIGQWNYITLVNPLPLDVSQELWVGYHINAYTGYPAGVDDGPAIEGYGNMMYFGGWQTMLEINPELDYNWNIQAKILTGISDSVARYAIYRMDDWNEYFLRGYSDDTYFYDDSAICYSTLMHCYKVTAIYESNSDFCESNPSNEVYEVCENVREQEIETDLTIYPNPASDLLKIEASEKMNSISIYSSQGDKVVRWKGDKVEVEIPVGDLVPGLYLVRVVTAGGVVARKVIIGR